MATDDAYLGNTVIIKPLNVAAVSTTQTTACGWAIFLSSTIGDLEEYRQQVQDALLKRAQVTCFRSEDWISNYGPTLQKCRDELEKANGYIGIFGYWYGSIPPGYKQSITHLEFIWAREKWQNEQTPPIAVLMPRVPSSAERTLKKIAASLIPAGKVKKKKHETLLKSFRDEVENTWKTVNYFKDEHELREHVIVICLQWRLGRPLDAATGVVEVVERETPARKVTNEEWGLLGRADHLVEFEKILNRVALFPDVPAVTILVHGNEDSGQRVFLRQLLSRKKLRSGRPVKIGRPQLEQYDLKALTQWVGESLGVLSKGKEIASLDELAELIHQELQSQQLGFILDQVYRLSGDLATWYEKFWQPLYARLAQLRKQSPQQNQHRLVAIVVDYKDQSAFDSDKSCQFSGTATASDYGRLWLLPVLRDISAGDLADWFDDLDVQDDAAGRRAALASLAMKNAKGETDGTPSRVFERLKQTSLWTNGEE